eukprot:scaffold1320_cov253-Pinguiococcus_pyrenoidosus.AAC.5
MRLKGSATSLWLCTALALAAGDQYVFFAEDLNSAATTNDADPLESFPLSTAERDRFLALLDGSAPIEDFESFAVGTEQPVLDFPGVGQGVLTDGKVLSRVKNGQYSTSGDNYLKTNSEEFGILFQAPVSAFGFMGVDIGDVSGMLSLSFQFTSGDSQVVEVAHLSNGPSGSVLFFGFIDTEKFIDGIVLSNSQRKDVSPQSSVLLCLDEREAGSRTVRWLIRVPSPSPQVYVIQSWPWLRSALDPLLWHV